MIYCMKMIYREPTQHDVLADSTHEMQKTEDILSFILSNPTQYVFTAKSEMSLKLMVSWKMIQYAVDDVLPKTKWQMLIILAYRRSQYYNSINLVFISLAVC